MLGWWKKWRRQRIIQATPLDEADWQRVMGRSLFRRLPQADRARLRQQVALFLHDKGFYGAEELTVTPPMRLIIAAEACLLSLNLDPDVWRGFHAIIIYPEAFHTSHRHVDEAGVVHENPQWQAGESWQRGPVLLSWPEVGPDHDDGVNLVIHEFAHQLDMRVGEADGFPPLHTGMSAQAWTDSFSRAYDELCAAVDRGAYTELDPYASESPAEFFAVTSEFFFTRPGRLRQLHPDVYRQLALFYRQDPLDGHRLPMATSRAGSAP